MKPFKINDNTWWNGALHPDVRVLNILLKTKNGTTYNSYVLKSKKIAIIDTVKNKYANLFIENIKSLVNPADIAYIIVQQNIIANLESLKQLLLIAPQAKIICSPSYAHLLQKFITTNEFIHVQDDFDLDLGERTLHFLLIPFLHRPEVFFIYLPEDKLLLPGDVFASHHCDTRMFDDLVRKFKKEFENYFRVLFRPYKKNMLTAIERIKNLEINTIAPCHGPILRSEPRNYLMEYENWCHQPGLNKTKQLLIFYATAYGETGRMAEKIATGARSVGVEVKVFNLLKDRIDSLQDKVEQADGVLFGSPTIHGDAVKPIWHILADLTTIDVTGKLAGSFGNYGWGGEAQALIDNRLQSLKFNVPEKGFQILSIPSEEQLKACEEFGTKFAKMVLAASQEK